MPLLKPVAGDIITVTTRHTSDGSQRTYLGMYCRQEVDDWQGEVMILSVSGRGEIRVPYASTGGHGKEWRVIAIEKH